MLLTSRSVSGGCFGTFPRQPPLIKFCLKLLKLLKLIKIPKSQKGPKIKTSNLHNFRTTHFCVNLSTSNITKWGSSIRIWGRLKSDGGRFGGRIWARPNPKRPFFEPNLRTIFLTFFASPNLSNCLRSFF